MNALTGDLLPLDDETCPRLKVDDVSFTRYPCVARVAPGQGFDFYLRLTNGGTNPATEIRVVDVFPRSGDTGVILTGEQRGTQWQAPPTLLSDVRLTGTGVLDIGYSPDSTPCTTLLDRPPTDCPVGSWVDGRDSSTAAFAAAITFDGGGLRPGGVRPPCASGWRPRRRRPSPSQNMIAWNSFAHTEFFSDGGRRVQLPATRADQDGRGLGVRRPRRPQGRRRLAGDRVPFGFTYRCVLRPEGPDGQPAAPVEVATGEFTLGAGESVRLTARPARATCAVWESDGSGLISDADGEANAKSGRHPDRRRSRDPGPDDHQPSGTEPLAHPDRRTVPECKPVEQSRAIGHGDRLTVPECNPVEQSRAIGHGDRLTVPECKPVEQSRAIGHGDRLTVPECKPVEQSRAIGDGDRFRPPRLAMTTAVRTPMATAVPTPMETTAMTVFLSQTGALTAVTVVGAIAGLLVLGGIATLGVSIRRRRL